MARIHVYCCAGNLSEPPWQLALEWLPAGSRGDRSSVTWNHITPVTLYWKLPGLYPAPTWLRCCTTATVREEYCARLFLFASFCHRNLLFPFSRGQRRHQTNNRAWYWTEVLSWEINAFLQPLLENIEIWLEKWWLEVFTHRSRLILLNRVIYYMLLCNKYCYCMPSLTSE
jgi:hypothetical protein